MTSSYKPTQGQGQEQLPPEEQGQQRHFVPPANVQPNTQQQKPQPFTPLPPTPPQGPANGIGPGMVPGHPSAPSGQRQLQSFIGNGQPPMQGLRERSLPRFEQRPGPANPPFAPTPQAQVPQTPPPPMQRVGAPPGQAGGQQPPRPFIAPNTPQPNGLEGGVGVQVRPPGNVRQQVQQRQYQEPEMERVGNNIILYRSPNFYVRTAYRPSHKTNPLRPSNRPSLAPKAMPGQETRIAASETRFMPKVTLIDQEKKKRFPVPSWLEAFVVVVGLLISVAAHAFNMFNFPRYELDEGTYMSNAWAVMNGLITPYAYGYGHPPVGWIQIAAWVQLIGGFFDFGNALNSGRVLMLFYAVGCSLLVYLITRRLGASRSAGLLAMVVFSLSPLSITYQRQTLLDNIATFWLLLSLFLLVIGNSRLFYVAGSAIAFGIAILSKEVFVLFVPVMIYAVWLHTTKFQRKFAMTAFIYTAIAITSAWVLMAILRGELFPYTWHLPWDTHPHLSMLDTFVSQVKRGQNEGTFMSSWNIWWVGDKVFMICSIATVAFNLIVGWWNRKQLLMALFAVSFWLLLIRGGVVLPFYLIPLIPLVAINVAFTIHTIMNWIGKLVRFDLVRAVLILGVIAVIAPYDVQASTLPFTQHPTSAQTQAMAWIRTNIPRNDFVVINSYLYMDMRQPGGAAVGNGAVFPFADVYFNVATDPEIEQGILNGKWDRIDYIIADSEMLNDIKNDPATYGIITQALQHSILLTTFKAADHSSDLVISVFEVRHLYGPPIVRVPSGSGEHRATIV